MNFYELAYIIPATTEDKDQSDIRNKISKTIGEHKGNIIAEPPSEKRKLSYIIKRTRQGVFQYIRFSADQQSVNQISSDLKLVPELLRYQVVKLNASSPTEVKSTATPNPIPVNNTRDARPAEKEEKKEEKKDEPKAAAVKTPAKDEKEEEKEAPVEETAQEEKAEEKKEKKKTEKKDAVNLEDLDKKIDELLEGDIIK